MPWVPELFSAPVVERLRQKWRRERLEAAPYYDGLLAGEHDALVSSFAGEPVLHDPLRGRVRGVRAFKAFVTDLTAWLAQRNASVEDVHYTITEQGRFEEVVLHLDGENARVKVPVAIVADHEADGRLGELRIYHSTWPLTGRDAHRPPLVQPDPELRPSDVVAEYQRALSTEDAGAIVATFEPDAYAREPAGGEYVHRGPGALRSFYETLFSNDCGIPLEHCALADDGRACALE